MTRRESQACARTVLADVHNHWHVRGSLFTGPAVGLLEKQQLEIIDANRTEVGTAEIEGLVTGGWPSAFK